MRGAWVTWVLGGVLLASAAGCGSGPHGASPLPEPALGSTVPPTSGRAGMMNAPLSVFQGGDAAGIKDAQAVRALSVTCMRKAGYQSYQGDNVSIPVSSAADDAVQLPAGGFGYLGADVAAAQAFRPPNGLAAAQAQQAAYHPSPAEGSAAAACLKEAVGSRPKVTNDLASRTFGESMDRVAKDSRVVAATTKWRACMKAAGFQVGDPGSLWKPSQAPGTPSAEEVALAEGDVTCTTQTNLAGIWFAALYGYQQELIDRDAQAFAQLRSQLAEHDAQVSKILTSNGS